MRTCCCPAYLCAIMFALVLPVVALLLTLVLRHARSSLSGGVRGSRANNHGWLRAMQIMLLLTVKCNRVAPVRCANHCLCLHHLSSCCC